MFSVTRVDFLKMKVDDVHNKILKEWDLPINDLVNLHATADTCKRQLGLLPSSLKKITVDQSGNFEVYSKEVRKLL